jgi:hypothetical protein
MWYPTFTKMRLGGVIATHGRSADFAHFLEVPFGLEGALPFLMDVWMIVNDSTADATEFSQPLVSGYMDPKDEFGVAVKELQSRKKSIHFSKLGRITRTPVGGRSEMLAAVNQPESGLGPCSQRTDLSLNEDLDHIRS